MTGRGRQIAALALLATSIGAGAGAARAQGGGAPAPAASPPAPGRLEQVWRAPAPSLGDRVQRARRAALQQGVWSLDSAGRAMLAGSFEGDPLSRAVAAARLAPDLPAVQMEYARALWLSGESPVSALRAAIGSLEGIPRHAEASLWFAGNLLVVIAFALAAGSLGFIALTALLSAPRSAHVLGDLFSRELPGFARAGLLAAVLLVPWALGEGPFGFALALLAVAALYGPPRQRPALIVAAVLAWSGAYPVARIAGATLEAFHADPVAEAAYAVASGDVLAPDRARLEAADPSDLLAARARARLERRDGNLGRADAEYRELLRALPNDPVVANNAANVRLALGHMGAAIDLYRKAAGEEGSPVVLFNLAQAHGLAFQVDELSAALARAQQAGGATVASLSELQRIDETPFVVDLPLSPSLLWRRLVAARGGESIAAALRGPLAPGRLADASFAGLAFGGVALAGALLGLAVRTRKNCGRCRRLLCPRCNPSALDRDVCESCYHLFYKSENAQRDLRMQRIEALRRRERRRSRLGWAASLVVPGAAGLLAGRPLRALLAALLFALSAACVWLRQGAVPDPLVAGAAGPFAFLSLAGAAGLVYVLLVATALAARRRG